MMHDDELAAKYPDLLPSTGENQPRDSDLELLISDLENRFSVTTPPPELEERIANALKLRAAEIRPAISVGRSRERAITGPAYLRPTRGGRAAGRAGQGATMTPRRISTIAAAVAAVLVVSLIGILLYSRSGTGTGGAGGTFQQRLLNLGGTQLVLGRAAGSASTRPISADVSTIERRLADRIDPTDIQVVAENASDHLIIYIAGRTGGLQQVLSLVGTTGQVNFIDTGSSALYVGTNVTGQTCTTSCRAGQYKILFTGAQFDPSSISAGLDPTSNQPAVIFQFQGAAQSAFAAYTANNIGNALTITLDNKVIESATIESQITGRGEISGGNMTIADIQNLASLLKSGALAVPLKVISETSFLPGTPAPSTVSCSTPTPAPAVASPSLTATATVGNVGSTSSTHQTVVEATTGPEDACATPTLTSAATPTATVAPPNGTPTATPEQTPTPTPVP